MWLYFRVFLREALDEHKGPSEDDEKVVKLDYMMVVVCEMLAKSLNCTQTK